MLTRSGSISVKSIEKAKQSKVSQVMNRINVGQESEKEERASVSSLAYFLSSEDKVRCANHLQNVGSLMHNPVPDNLLVPY